MNRHNEHDALARKRRFVQSLTRSHARFLKDDNFLKPLTPTGTEDTSTTPQPSRSQQGTLLFNHEPKETSSLIVFTHYLCERCTFAIAKAHGTSACQLVLCAQHIHAFPTNHQCTSFNLDESAHSDL